MKTMGREPELCAGLYRGTAPYYDRYRPGYPAALFDDLCDRAQVSGTGTLLDLACGTGQVAFALAGRFAGVVALDQEAETVGFGRAKAQAAGLGTIRWITGAAETVELDPGFEMVAVGTAFHRLNRPLVAGRVLSWLRPAGAVALLWSETPSEGGAPWQQALTELAAAWMERVGTTGRIPPGWDRAVQRDPHEAVLASAGFEYLGKFEFRRQERWTAETLIGFMHSTSVLNRGVLGDDVKEFELAVETLVETHAPGGVVVADASYAYQLARKPS